MTDKIGNGDLHVTEDQAKMENGPREMDKEQSVPMAALSGCPVSSGHDAGRDPQRDTELRGSCQSGITRSRVPKRGDVRGPTQSPRRAPRRGDLRCVRATPGQGRWPESLRDEGAWRSGDRAGRGSQQGQ